MVFTRAQFDELPEDGRWEVSSGRAVLMPFSAPWHQGLSDDIVSSLRRQILDPQRGWVVSAGTVFLPVPPGTRSEIQSRIPDIVVSRQRRPKGWPVGSPPEFVIEILSTRRGNVERTEKIDDYARAGIEEYWIVNPIDRDVEIYALSAGEYMLVRKTQRPESITFPGVEIDMAPFWPNPADFD